MTDEIDFDVWQAVRAHSSEWYRCVQYLGRGENAVTYLVQCASGSNQGVLFVLKIFYTMAAQQRRESFLSEMAFMQSCAHPSLVRIFDRGVFFDQEQQFPFVVVEYLPMRLFDVVHQGAVTVTQKISYSLQLLSALSYLEGLDPPVVHRDVTPQSIFLKGGSCVLAHFRHMKLLDGSGDDDPQAYRKSIASMGYRTPDLVDYARQEAELTTKSDVFQLGLVLAELFTEQNPQAFPKRYLDPVKMDPLEEIPGDLGGGIARLLKEMLIMDADSRPRASELLEGWQALFHDAVERAHERDGRAIMTLRVAV